MKRSGFKRLTPEQIRQKQAERRNLAFAAPAPLAEGRTPNGSKRVLKASHSLKGRKRARLKRQQGTIHADAIWSWVIRERDDHRCQRCGKRDQANNHAHHVAPRSRRPDLKKVLSNGMTVCPPCHKWIHDNPIEAEAKGFLSFATYEKAKKDES